MSAVNTGKVTGRRPLSFNTLDDVVAEAERLAAAERAGNLRMLGNMPLGTMLDHLARAMDVAIDGTDAKLPLHMRLMLSLFRKPMKRQLAEKGLPAGFRLPKRFEPVFMPPAAVSTEDGLAHLRHSVERLKTETKRAPHIAFGTITHEEWDLVQCRHAELHLSFAVPAE